MTKWPQAALIVLIGLGSADCRSDTRDGKADSVQTPPSPSHIDADSAGAARARIGVIFDPGRVRPGDSVGDLVVARVAVDRASADSSYVGTIAFIGDLALSGRTIRHFDADATDAACFEADPEGAARLPRWAGDRRRSWFCFSNATAARRALGTPPPERSQRIVIGDFAINRGLSDQVNSARFIRRLAPIRPF